MKKVKPAVWVIIGIVVLIIIGVIVACVVCRKDMFEPFAQSKVFRSSPSLTFLKREDIPRKDFVGLNYEETVAHLKELTYTEKAQKGEVLNVEDGNLLNMPTYFNAHDKWPGCLPSPAFQGNCGSCWAFAVTTCLSSRFYIETCGNTGCFNYPQFNQAAFNKTIEEINKRYKFRRTSLLEIGRAMDVDNDRKISQKEWKKAIKKFHHDALYVPEKEYVSYQALMFLLNFHSMGSIPFSKKHPNTIKIMERSERVFKIVKNLTGTDYIDGKSFIKRIQDRPIPLSSEKLILCCIPNCFVSARFAKDKTQCLGESLVSAWQNVRDLGTISSLCSGYSLDNWYRGKELRTCGQLLGPEFSYCSGYAPNDFNSKIINPVIQKSNETGISPFALVPDDTVLPWEELQYFVFKAKNAYEVNDDVLTIQREIMKRGPVTTGFHIYPDFEDVFAPKGGGGQKYRKGDRILGGEEQNIIYMHFPVANEKKPVTGHAVVIVGWGIYEEIPYWVCLNSWGIEWGTSGYTPYKNRTGLPINATSGGYFWFVRGINNCGIEENVVAGQPNLLNITYPGTKQDFGLGLPYPEESTVTFIDPTDPKKLDQRKVGFVFNPYVEGGGQYARDVTKKEKGNPGIQRWALDSMHPPSPYLFFWPEERPLYILGEILKPLKKDKKDRTLYVSKETLHHFRYVYKTSDHSFLIIGDEQVQTDKILENGVTVFRSINNTPLQNHTAGTKILIYPYHELNSDDLVHLPQVPRKPKPSHHKETIDPLPISW